MDGIHPLVNLVNHHILTLIDSDHIPYLTDENLSTPSSNPQIRIQRSLTQLSPFMISESHSWLTSALDKENMQSVSALPAIDVK